MASEVTLTRKDIEQLRRDMRAVREEMEQQESRLTTTLSELGLTLDVVPFRTLSDTLLRLDVAANDSIIAMKNYEQFCEEAEKTIATKVVN